MNELKLIPGNVAKAFRDIILKAQSQDRIYSCPELPIEIPGITFGDALDAGDALGTPFPLKVPKRGIIYSATFWDMDDDGFQVDFKIFKEPIAAVAWDSAYAPTDAEQMNYITTLKFVAFNDDGTSQISEILNIGKAYTAPQGKFWIQAVARGASNIAAGNSPRFQLHILPLDPSWEG
jgi:hypothetical protein